MEWSIHWLIDWFIHRLTDWFIEWSIHWLIDWFIDCSIGWLIDWLIDCSIDRMIECLIDWLIDWLHFFFWKTNGMSFFYVWLFWFLQMEDSQIGPIKWSDFTIDLWSNKHLECYKDIEAVTVLCDVLSLEEEKGQITMDPGDASGPSRYGIASESIEDDEGPLGKSSSKFCLILSMACLSTGVNGPFCSPSDAVKSEFSSSPIKSKMSIESAWLMPLREAKFELSILRKSPSPPPPPPFRWWGKPATPFGRNAGRCWPSAGMIRLGRSLGSLFCGRSPGFGVGRQAVGSSLGPRDVHWSRAASILFFSDSFAGLPASAPSISSILRFCERLGPGLDRFSKKAFSPQAWSWRSLEPLNIAAAGSLKSRLLKDSLLSKLEMSWSVETIKHPRVRKSRKQTSHKLKRKREWIWLGLIDWLIDWLIPTHHSCLDWLIDWYWIWQLNIFIFRDCVDWLVDWLKIRLKCGKILQHAILGSIDWLTDWMKLELKEKKIKQNTHPIGLEWFDWSKNDPIK